MPSSGATPAVHVRQPPPPATRPGSGRGVLRGLALLVVAVGALLALAAPALAHAVLVQTDPEDGANLDAAPEVATLVFNEGVELPDGGLRVFDADAQRVDEGVVDTGDAATVAVGLPDDLPDGGYLLTYRVVSQDSHPISGVIGFTVGDGEAIDGDTAAELAGTGDGVLGVAGSVVRGLGYVATLLAAGAALFALRVARTDPDRLRAQRVGLAATGAAVGVTLLAWPLQTMAVTGQGLVDALALSALGDTLRSGFGQSWLTRLSALALLAVAWRGTVTRWPAAALGLVAAGSFALDGHQRSMDPTVLLVAGDLVHLAAGALWLGGLVLLAMCVRSRSLDDDPVGAARLVQRFSTLALWSVIALTISGLAMAWALVRVPAALTSTGYGVLLLTKVVLVLVAVAIAGYNRWRLVPIVSARTPARGAAEAPPATVGTSPRARAAWRRLGGTLGLEAFVLVAVLLLTGFLAVERPAADAAGVTGLYDTTVAVTDELDLDVVVDPNRAGETNQIHLYALDATGRPSGEVEDLELRLTYAEEGIGPFVVEPFPAGPGHWVANVDELTFAGDWTVEVTLGIDRFTEERVELTVPVS
jgi:copper transport protein